MASFCSNTSPKRSETLLLNKSCVSPRFLSKIENSFLVCMQIHTVVSGALDRLHYERDPCVKYDSNRKVWIYLHRNRSEEEFGNLIQKNSRLMYKWIDGMID